MLLDEMANSVAFTNFVVPSVVAVVLLKLGVDISVVSLGRFEAASLKASPRFLVIVAATVPPISEKAIVINCHTPLFLCPTTSILPCHEFFFSTRFTFFVFL